MGIKLNLKIIEAAEGRPDKTKLFIICETLSNGNELSNECCCLSDVDRFISTIENDLKEIRKQALRIYGK